MYWTKNGQNMSHLFKHHVPVTETDLWLTYFSRCDAEPVRPGWLSGCINTMCLTRAEGVVCLKRLEVLELRNGNKLYIYPAGLPALSGLLSLCCNTSFSKSSLHNRTDDALMMLTVGAFVLPRTLSALTCLSKLCIECRGPSVGSLDLGNLYLITTLQHLSICCQTNIFIGRSLTALQQLTALALSVTLGLAEEDLGNRDIQDLPELSLDVDWATLQQFHRITIEADVLRCHFSFLHLVKASSLELIEIKYSRPCDVYTSNCCATFMQGMS